MTILIIINTIFQIIILIKQQTIIIITLIKIMMLMLILLKNIQTTISMMIISILIMIKKIMNNFDLPHNNCLIQTANIKITNKKTTNLPTILSNYLLDPFLPTYKIQTILMHTQ
jgi:hypothetical protein